MSCHDTEAAEQVLETMRRPSAMRSAGKRSARRRVWGRGWRVVLVVGAVALACLARLTAQNPPQGEASAPTEEDFKVTWIFQFINNLQWPSESAPANHIYRVAVLDTENKEQELIDKLRGASPEEVGCRIEVERVQGPQDLSRFQVVYVSNTIEARLTEATLGELARRKVLVIGEHRNFIKNGGMISLNWDGKINRVRIKLDPTRLREAGFEMPAAFLAALKPVLEGA